MAQVMLWWPDRTVDDHERPQRRLWELFHYPETAMELIVTEDGAVIEADTLYDQEMLTGTSVRHMQVMESTSSTAVALRANGYELRSV